MSYDPDNELKKNAAQNSRLLFYPSCGTDCGWLFDHDYDVFVLADYYPRNQDNRSRFWQGFRRSIRNRVSLIASTVRTRVFQVGNKIGFLFFQDNNEVLERIKNSGNRISCFVGICDGCSEGGNYECVNNFEFLDKVISLINPSGMIYLTDHSEFLFPCSNIFHYPPQKTFQEFIIGKKIFRYLDTDGDQFISNIRGSRREWGMVRSDGGYGLIKKYEVTFHTPDVSDWKGKNLRLTIEHDSIVNHLKELNGAVMSSRCRHLCKRLDPKAYDAIGIKIVRDYYFKPSINSDWSSRESLNLLLKICSQKKWEIVGTTAFGDGEHSEFISILNNWTGDNPKWIRIFHLDSGDFSELKQHLVNMSNRWRTIGF
jgi:hypothetical protein